MNSYNFSNIKNYYYLFLGENIEGLYIVFRRIRLNIENRLWLWFVVRLFCFEFGFVFGEIFCVLFILGKNYIYRNYGNELVGLLGEKYLFEYWVV